MSWAPPQERPAPRSGALTWMADSGIPLHVLQRVAGHQDPAMTARYLHPDHRALTDAGEAFGARWTQDGHKNGREECGGNAAETA